MNNLFVDIIDENLSYKANVIEKGFLKLFGFLFKEDKLLNESKSKTFFLLVKSDKLSSGKKNYYVLSKVLKNKISNFNNINIVFSRLFENVPSLKKQVTDLLFSINKEASLVQSINNLNELDSVYISRYILERKKDINKFKLLIVIDYLKDFDINKLKKYIEKYKFVDILRMQNITKIEYKKLDDLIDKVNEEYGSSIEIIQKRNIQEYDFCILLSSNIKEYFKSHYILGKDSYVLDITDVDNDILSKEYKSYQRNKGYIETIFNRMNLSMENFLKTDIGSIYLHY